MGSIKRNFFRLAGGIGLLLVFLAALLLLLPRLIERDWAREKIATAASGLIGGTVEVAGSDLHYWPRPHVEIRGARFAIPGKAAGTIRTLTVYPRIVPLFWGEVRVSGLRFDSAAVSVTIPDKVVSAPEKEGAVPAPASLEESVRFMLDAMAGSVPDLKLMLADVLVDISGRDFPPLSFRDIEGSVVLPPSGPDIDLSCTGTLWERGSVTGHFKGKTLVGKGRIVLNGFRPHLLAGSLLPNTGAGISESEIDMDLRVEADGWAKLHAEGDISFPRVMLHRGKRKLELAGGAARGTLVRDGKKTTLALKQISLESPRLMISGNLFLDGEARRSRAVAQAGQIEISSVREHALALAGDVTLVRDIFSIVKAGTIAELAFRAEGETADDLRKFENMHITGTILDGKITVDAGKANLPIDRVLGNLAISRGILTASDLSGSMGKIVARQGTLRMGFLESDAPFRLEADVTADAAELPTLLNRLISSESFRKELSLVTDWKGNASGRMILGETVEALRLRVEADAMSLSAKYRRLPYPLAISGGRLVYRGEEIAVTGARGEMGGSTFSDLSGKVRWTESPSLEIRSGKLRLSLDELVPWARETEGLGEYFAGIRDAGGAAAISVTRLNGPVFSPGEWAFDVSGNVENLSFATPSVPGTIDVAYGNFRASPDTLIFDEVRAKGLDASVSVSGSLKDYRTDLQRGEATVSGRLDQETIGFLYDLGKIPPAFAVRPPVEASGVRLEWQNFALKAVNGDLTIGGGPMVSVDFLRHPGEWVVRNLSLVDEDSSASLSFHRKPGSLDLAFEGRVSRETANRIFVSGSSAGGFLKGDLRASLRFDQPGHSTARGTLEGEQLRFLHWFGIPLFVDTLSLSAEGSRVAVRSAEVLIGDGLVKLAGEATASPDGLAFDLDASADSLDWNSLKEAFKTSEKKEESPAAESGTGKRTSDLPVRGTMRLHANRFRFGRHTVEPAVVEIVYGKPGTTVAIKEASYCGIPFTGTIRTTRGETAFEIRPDAKGGDLDSTYDCLTEEKGRVTGRFDLAGEMAGRIREGEGPLRSLRGKLNFTARNGRIYGTPILSRVLAFLNVTEIFRGTLPDMLKDGLEYLSLSIRGEIRDGSAEITEYVLDGNTVDVVGQGRIDLGTRECDLQMLAAPFKTVNYVIGKIPLLGRILGGTLVEVPVKVSGTTEDPKVSLLHPAAVGKNLLGIVERTFKLPAELILPVLPGEKSEDR